MAIIHLIEDNYDEVTSRDGIVMVDFWAEWCAACKDFSPVYERIAKKYSQHTFAKLDTVDQKQVLPILEIEHIPTLMLYRDGVLLFQQPGYFEEEKLEDIIRQAESLDMDEVRAHLAAEKDKNNIP